MKIPTTWKASDPNQPESPPREVVRFGVGISHGVSISHYRIVEHWDEGDGARYRTLERCAVDAMGDEFWKPVKRRPGPDGVLLDALQALCVFSDAAKEPAS